MGLMTFTLSIADNYSIDIIPDLLKNRNKDKNILSSFIKHLIDLIRFPFCAYEFATFTKKFPVENCPLNLSKISKTGVTYETDVTYTKNYSLGSAKQLAKKLKITFNDLMLCLVSKAFSRYGHENKGFDYMRMNYAIPLGLKNMPKDPSEVQLSNDVMAVVTALDRIDDIPKECMKIHNEVNRTVKNSARIKTLTSLQTIIDFFPNFIKDSMTTKLKNSITLCVSNIPGPTVPVYYSSYEIVDVFPSMSAGVTKSFFSVFTYKDSFKISCCIDNIFKIPAEMITNYINEEFEKLASDDTS